MIKFINSPFWKWFDQKQKIKRLAKELDKAAEKWDTKEIYRIAKAQQRLLDKL